MKLGGKDYDIPEVLTLGMYETLVPILNKLDSGALLSKDIKLSEITLLLASKGQLQAFLGTILGCEESELTDVDVNEAIGVVSNFFSTHGLTFMISGLFYFPEEIQEKIQNVPSES